jgi:hypothetical protein
VCPEWQPAAVPTAGPGWVHLPGLEVGEHDRLRELLDSHVTVAGALAKVPSSSYTEADVDLLKRAVLAIGPPF